MFFELFILVLCLISYLHYKKRRNLPPGPVSIPFFGSLEVFFGADGESFFKKKFQKYGDMYSILVGPFNTVVMLNNLQLTKDLFSRDEFSGILFYTFFAMIFKICLQKGRMKLWFHQNIRGTNGRNLGIINTDGPTWTAQRRFALKELRDLGFGRKSLDSAMQDEVDEVIDKLLQIKTGIIEMDSTFNTAIINVLWQIVASKRFDPDSSDTKRMMSLLNMQFKSGSQVKPKSLFPLLRRILPFDEREKSFFEMKAMMRELIRDHMANIDYDNPRDFIDVYLKQIHDVGDLFDVEHLVVICLDFFQAGAETTR